MCPPSRICSAQHRRFNGNAPILLSGQVADRHSELMIATSLESCRSRARSSRPSAPSISASGRAITAAVAEAAERPVRLAGPDYSWSAFRSFAPCCQWVPPY
jgi:hypothetical protein